ncbi:DNRLRE domain-containing protein [Clostridium sp.]|uniref:DNRLRE domain-containing protein n=1 Tax=Clostridium sp. TaxID=1506 RepID=UPI002605FC91|nr:DNRLRE domain-containing protein [Clostridium sp.]
MASIIIPASKSLTIIDKFPTENINNNIISVGNNGINNYISYLFFDISTIPNDVLISYAELVLFKTDKFYNDDNKIFEVYSLDEYFSTYTTFKNHPKINDSFKKIFYPVTSKAAVTIPITSLVKLWLKDFNINTSIMLCSKSKNSLLHFGSAICKQKYLVPFLKVYFTSYNNQLLRSRTNPRSKKEPMIQKNYPNKNNNNINNINNDPINSLINQYDSVLKNNPLQRNHNNVLLKYYQNNSTLDPPFKKSAFVNSEILDSYPNILINKNNSLLNSMPFHNNIAQQQLQLPLTPKLAAGFIVPFLITNSIINNQLSLDSLNSIIDNIFILLKDIFTHSFHDYCTLRQIHVTGTVAPYSKYIAAVNIKVQRHSSNHIDNYYTTDIYDNLSSNFPMHIDKTYNIAIMPKIDLRDNEKILFYGSYKE